MGKPTRVTNQIRRLPFETGETISPRGSSDKRYERHTRRAGLLRIGRHPATALNQLSRGHDPHPPTQRLQIGIRLTVHGAAAGVRDHQQGRLPAHRVPK